MSKKRQVLEDSQIRNALVYYSNLAYNLDKSAN